MKILISGYNCSPYRGSECAVGWNSALTAAEFGHEVTVITNCLYREEIEKFYKENTNCPIIHFMYIKIPAILDIKGYVGELIQYRYFQNKVIETANSVLNTMTFDYIQHTSWASLIQKNMLYKLNIPLVIGPVGGGEETPSVLMSNYSMRNKIKESIRKIAIFQALHSKWFKEMCSKSIVMFATTDETYKYIPEKFRYKTYVKQCIGINYEDIPIESIVKNNKPFRVLMVGRLIYWKGFDLGIRAIKQLLDKGFEIELHIIGTGKERERLETMSGKWLNERIFFHGNISYKNVQQLYMNSNALINTSLHDSGCMVVLEAMANGLPVICIDTGGPKVLTTDECAIKIAPEIPNKTVENIENAIHKLVVNPNLCDEIGSKARIRVRDEFEFSNKFKSIESIIVKHLNQTVHYQ